MVNYEIDIPHVRSLRHNYTSVSYFTLVSGSSGSAIVSEDSNNSGGMQVRMERGHLLLSGVPIWREIKVRVRGPSII